MKKVISYDFTEKELKSLKKEAGEMPPKCFNSKLDLILYNQRILEKKLKELKK